MDRIPPESLTCIFNFVCQLGGRTDRTGFLATNSSECCKAIVALTHICRYWRETVLSNPKFWTTANLTHPFMTSSLLERSCSMPIVATYITHGNPKATVPSTEALLPHFSRIQKVHINTFSLRRLMDFLSVLSGHSSILEAVELHRNPNYPQFYPEDNENEDKEDVEVWRWVFELPAMVEDASSLTFFRVSNLPFSNCFLELRHLTHLELSCSVVWTCNYLAVIAANPMLEVVILRSPGNWGLQLYDPWAIGPAAVSVPHLRRLELYDLFVEQILVPQFALPPGIHLSCACSDGYVLPPSNDLLVVGTVEKLHFMFSMDEGIISRVASGSGLNGTFLLSDSGHLAMCLFIPQIPRGSLTQLSISVAEPGAGEGNPPLTFVDVHAYFLSRALPPFARLQALILQRVHGCEVILRLLCDPLISPQLNTVVLVNVQSHATYWLSLVELARARKHHSGSSNIVRVEVGCRAEEPPEPDQLAKLREHVFSVEIKPWNYEVEDLDWLSDSRFCNLGRL